MSARTRNTKEKDASTRFMRVDQLGSAQTVAVPAAQLLAAAAASVGPGRRAAAARSDDAPTVAMEVAATLSAPTVALTASAGPKRKASTPAPSSRGTQAERSAPRARARRALPVARAAALAVIVLVVLGAVLAFDTWSAARPKRGADERTLNRREGASSAAASSAGTGASASEPATAAEHAPAAATAVHTAARDASADVLPATAVEQLAAGDYAAALASYQNLAHTWPEERAFALVAQVLERKLQGRCAADATHGAAACER